MGFIRKALFVATAGLSGLVFKDNSNKERAAKAAAEQVRPRKQAKATRPKTQAARRPKTQAARRPKTQAARRPKTQAAQRPKTQAARRAKPQAARTATVARTAGSGNGTITELERLADLHGRGALTAEEFAAAKAKILGTRLTPPGSGRDPASFQAVDSSVTAARQLADLAAYERGASVATVGD
jgi:uncharacterized protein YPO0396